MRRHGYRCEIQIHAKAQAVFDFCSDLRNELRWNDRARSVVKLTDGPVDVGTRFRGQWVATKPVDVEIVEYVPPTSWASTSRTSGLEVCTRGTVVPTLEGASYAIDIAARPTTLGARITLPLVLRIMRRGERRNMASIKAALESSASLIVATTDPGPVAHAARSAPIGGGPFMRRYVYFYLMKREPGRVREIAPDHVAYWDRLGLRGYVGGPFADRDGGLITFEAEDLDQAERAIEEDPFVVADLVQQRWTKEWLAEAPISTGLPAPPQETNIRVDPGASVEGSASRDAASRG
jgi:uncharacterized protein YciI